MRNRWRIVPHDTGGKERKKGGIPAANLLMRGGPCAPVSKGAVVIEKEKEKSNWGGKEKLPMNIEK